MKEKIQIKSISGELLFELEKENNTVKDTALEAIEQEVDLSYADLSGVDLSGADFRCADLYHVNFSKANLNDTDFRRANLHSASLREANLRGADFRYADLSSADLYGASPISAADFIDANLSGAYGANTILFGKKLQ